MATGFVPTEGWGEGGGILNSWMHLEGSPVTHFKAQLVSSKRRWSLSRSCVIIRLQVFLVYVLVLLGGRTFYCKFRWSLSWTAHRSVYSDWKVSSDDTDGLTAGLQAHCRSFWFESPEKRRWYHLFQIQVEVIMILNIWITETLFKVNMSPVWILIAALIGCCAGSLGAEGWCSNYRDFTLFCSELFVLNRSRFWLVGRFTNSAQYR